MNRFTIGVDLGQTTDYTAIGILEEKEMRHYQLRHLERFRHVPYPAVVERIRWLVGRLPGTPSLVVDATGVGRPVVDMIRQADLGADLYAVTLTAGDAVVKHGHDWRVPKRDLASTMAVLLQTKRLRISQALKEAGTPERELLSFRVKITLAGNDTYEAWRKRDHDDLVLAVSLACWLNEKGRDAWLMLIQQSEEAE